MTSTFIEYTVTSATLASQYKKKVITGKAFRAQDTIKMIKDQILHTD